MCVSLCTIVVHNTAQSSSDKLPSHTPDKHHWREGKEVRLWDIQILCLEVKMSTKWWNWSNDTLMQDSNLNVAQTIILHSFCHMTKEKEIVEN